MNKFIRNISVLVLFAIIASCNVNDSEYKGDVVSRVGDYYLYESDINKLLKNNISKVDSTLIVDGYIERWARRKVVLAKAQLNLSEDEANFNRLIEEYREGLITSAYRQKLVAQYLDTVIVDEEIEDFYNKNKSNFLLNNNLVMLKYANFPASISNKKEVVKLIKSNKLEDYEALEALCYQFSSRFGISDSTWVPLNDLKLNMPELNYVKNKDLLKKDNFIEIQDSLNLYLTRILDVRKKRQIAPISFVEERIYNIILNKRKLELIRKMEHQIMEDAIKNREFETYK